MLVRLVLERVAGSAGSVSSRIAALDHEVRDHAMEREPVVEALAGELGEVGDRLRRVCVVELDLDRAVIRVEGGLGHGGTVAEDAAARQSRAALLSRGKLRFPLELPLPRSVGESVASPRKGAVP